MVSLRFKKFLAKKKRVETIKKVPRQKSILPEIDDAINDLRNRTQFPEIDDAVNDLRSRTFFPELDDAVIDTFESAGSAIAGMNREGDEFDDAVDDAIPKGEL